MAAIGISSRTLPAPDTAARPAALAARLRLRGFLWAATLGLTLTLLVYPIDLRLHYSAIQSVDAIDDLQRFGALYYVWLLALAALLFTVPDDRRHAWEHAGIACVFTVVFLGFFMAHEPLPGLRAESGKLVALARLVNEFNELPVSVVKDPSDPRLESILGQGIAEFPGLGLAVAATASATGLGPTQSTVILLVIYLLTFPVLLYLLLAAWLHSRRLAVLGTLLYFQGNLVIGDGSPGLHGQFFGTLLFVGFLYLVNRSGRVAMDSVADRYAALVLLGAATVMHFLSAVLFAFALLGSGALRKLRGQEARELASVALYLALPAVWLTYWAVITFNSAVVPLGDFLEDAVSGRTLSSLGLLAQANAGETVPLWATGVRLLWLALLLVPGGLVALGYLWPWRPRHAHQDLAGQGTGIALFELSSGVVSKAGSYLIRAILHVPLFTIPLMLGWIEQRRSRLRAVLAGALVAVFVTSSLPAFFSHHPTVSTGAVYSSEESAGQHLEREFGDGGSLRIYTSAVQLAALRLWVPLKSFVFEGTPESTEDVEEYWSTWELVMRRYHERPAQTPVFVWSPVRMTTLAQHLYGVRADDPRWTAMIDDLERRSSRFYDTGQLQMYTQKGGIDEPFSFDGPVRASAR